MASSYTLTSYVNSHHDFEAKFTLEDHSVLVTTNGVASSHEIDPTQSFLDQLHSIAVIDSGIFHWTENNAAISIEASQDIYDCLPLLLSCAIPDNHKPEIDHEQQPDWFIDCLDAAENLASNLSSPFLVNGEPWAFWDGGAAALPVSDEGALGLVNKSLTSFGCIESASMMGMWDGKTIGYWSDQVLIEVDHFEELYSYVYVRPVTPIAEWIHEFLEVDSIQSWTCTDRSLDNPLLGNEALINAYIYELENPGATDELPNLLLFVDPDDATVMENQFPGFTPHESTFVWGITVPTDKKVRQEALACLKVTHPEFPITFPRPIQQP